MFIDIRKRERGREREKKKLKWEKNINWWPPVGAPTEDGTCNLAVSLDWESNHNLLVYGTTLQAMEPPSQGEQNILKLNFVLIRILINGTFLYHYDNLSSPSWKVNCTKAIDWELRKLFLSAFFQQLEELS